MSRYDPNRPIRVQDGQPVLTGLLGNRKEDQVKDEIRKRCNVMVALMTLGWLVAVAGPAKGDGNEWPEFHGPSRDSISRETGLLNEWPEEGPKLLWTASDCGRGFSSVAIVGGFIYTAGTFENQTFVIALDMDGEQVWKSANGERWAPSAATAVWARNYDGSRSTPTVNGGWVYHFSDLGRLAAFDAKTGEEKWAVDITEAFGAEWPHWGYAESVLIDGDRLICYPGGTNGYMVALDKKTGKTVWVNAELDAPASYCSPILVEDNGLRQIITANTYGVIGVNADTGATLWQYEHTNKRKINVATPIYHDGYVFASSGYGKGSVMLKLTVEGKKVEAEKVWFSTELDNHHGGVILLDGYLYGTGSKKSGWVCLHFKTGKVMHREEGVGKGSVVCAEGMLYCYAEKGTMGLVKASPKAHKLAGSFKVPEGGKGQYWAHPVVCGGRLYVRHADNLYAYDISGR